MKRLTAAFVILALIIGLCFFGRYQVVKICKESQVEMELLAELSTSVDWFTMKKELQEQQKKFDRNQIILLLFVQRNRLEQIETAFDESFFWIQSQNPKELRKKLFDLSHDFKGISRQHSIQTKTFL
ncbi:MAG: hypothetical protein IKI29_00660 [Clostridia bacterium]|nr:hypothetical protein [Clostridia bacterium]